MGSPPRFATRVALLVALAALLIPAGSASAQGTTVACPATFEVLHDDRIGSLTLEQGSYAITARGLTCRQASDLFRQFLEDWDGRLPRPWRLDAGTRTFTQADGSGISFTVTPAPTPSGGGSGGRHPATGTTCPAYFRVLHNDRIGALRVSAGSYTITLLSVGPISCAQASRAFARFLQDYDGRLPRPWTLDTETGTFFRGSARYGFRVEQAVGPAPAPSGGGTHPSAGRRCSGTFRVQHNDRIGRLRLPAGPYIVTLLRSRGLSCPAASRRFRAFLSSPSGLPSPWRLAVRTATFSRGRGGSGFRVKPVRRVR